MSAPGPGPDAQSPFDADGRAVLTSRPRSSADRSLLSPEAAAALEAAERDAADRCGLALAAGTARNYRGHVRAWADWAAASGVRVFPAAPGDVALHLAARFPLVDGDGFLADGALVGRSMRVRVSALDRWHAANGEGHGRPGDAQEVLDVVAAAEAAGPPEAPRSDPLFVEDLVGLLRRRDLARVEHEAARDDFLLLLCAEPDVRQADVPRVRARDAHALPGGVVVRPGAGPAVLLPRTGGPGCPVRALERLAAARTALLGLPDGEDDGADDDGFDGPDGGGAVPDDGDAQLLGTPGRPAMTRQGLVLRARARALAAGGPVALSVGRSGIPRPLRDDAARAVPLPAVEPPDGPRDRCLAVVGFLGALRPSSVGALRWSDLAPVPGMGPRGPVGARIGRSKADQEGRGWDFVLEDTGSPLTSPSAVLWEWHDRLADLVGGSPWDVCPDWPVLPPLAVAGRLKMTEGRPVPLSGAAVGDALGRLARAGGVEGRILGGSLRSGLVSSLAERGASVHEAQDHTDHRSLSVIRYGRPRPGRVGTAGKLGL